MAGKEYRVALGAQQGNLIRKAGRLQNKSGNGNFTPATLFLNFRKLSDMFEAQTYTRRRNELRKRLGGGLILLPGNHESSANYPGNTFPFRQDSTFLYFFGLHHPGYAGVLDADSGEDMLFGEDYTIDDIIWMGPQPSLADQALKAGVTRTAGLNELAETIRTAIAAGRRIHFLPPYRGETTLMLSDLLGIRPDALAQYVSVPLAKTVVALREIKDAEEIAEIERACTIGTKMHLQVMQMCRPGVVEQEIAGAIDGIALQYGAGVSFMSIVSQNGETLHNHYHGNVLEGGRLLLVDAGAETNMNYCSDFTRPAKRHIRYCIGSQFPHVRTGPARRFLLANAQCRRTHHRRRAQGARTDAGRHGSGRSLRGAGLVYAARARAPNGTRRTRHGKHR